MNTPSAKLQIQLPNYKLLGRGKVRDIYEVNEYLLIIATDRISAFDFILGTAIPEKGIILTQMSLFWFQMIQDIVPNHLVTADVRQFPPPLPEFKALLENRSMLVKRALPFPVECVARGYLAGSGWKEYQNRQSICGIPLPPGLKESSELPEPIFTPATKAVTGHDENISFESMSELIGKDIATRLREYTLKIYAQARDYARTRGIIIADTKFEFGLFDGNIILIDEVMTPDSSRFWPASDYAPGRPQKSFDKQFVRDYLEEIRWNKQAPAPSLPDWVAEATKNKYLEAYELLTGRKLPE
jgi:phosphoribosylaminoimidazole-succinocarboxamide synthase